MVHWCFLHVWNIVSVCFYQIWYSYLTLLVCFLLHKWEHTNTVTETCCKCCRNTVSLLSVYDDVGSSWQFLQCISDDTQINCDKSANNPVHIQTVTFKRNAHLATTFALASFLFSRNITRMQTAGTWVESPRVVLIDKDTFRRMAACGQSVCIHKLDSYLQTFNNCSEWLPSIRWDEPSCL